MTQKDLAERLNVSDKTVSRWERDDGAPDLSAIPVIAEIFGVTCDELLRGAAYGFSALNLCAGLLWLANGQLNTLNTLFGFACAAEYLIALRFYWIKRKKA